MACTGHRRLKDPEALQAQIALALRVLLAEARCRSCPLEAVSSIAAGADTLFAETALSLDLPWHAVLPLEEANFASDFADDPEGWRRAQLCLSRAASTRVARPSNPGALKFTSREEAYAGAGRQMLDEADFLLAIWDGRPARGIGGTAEIVAYGAGKPLLWIDADLGAVRKNEWPRANRGA